MDDLPDPILFEVLSMAGLRPRHAPTTRSRQLLLSQVEATKSEKRLRWVRPYEMPDNTGKALMCFAPSKKMNGRISQEMLSLVDETTPIFVHLPVFDISTFADLNVKLPNPFLTETTMATAPFQIVRLVPRYNRAWVNGALLLDRSDCIRIVLHLKRVVGGFIDYLLHESSEMQRMEIFPLHLNSTEAASFWGLIQNESPS
jgi:hypothetical protein